MKSLADIGRPALRRLLSATYVPQAARSLDEPRSVSRLGCATWPTPGRLVNMELCRRFRRHRAFSVAAVSTPWVAAWPWAPTASAAARPPRKRRARRQPAGRLPTATWFANCRNRGGEKAGRLPKVSFPATFTYAYCVRTIVYASDRTRLYLIIPGHCALADHCSALLPLSVSAQCGRLPREAYLSGPGGQASAPLWRGDQAGTSYRSGPPQASSRWNLERLDAHVGASAPVGELPRRGARHW